MSFALDVNILLYASDSASPLHEPAASFLDECVQGSGVFYLGWPTVMGYLRIATHVAVFERPLTPVQAAANIEALLTLPHTRLLAEDERFWKMFRATTADIPTRGNLVPDAHLAALLREHGIKTLYTHDRDFRRFDFLDVRDPFAVA